MTRAPSYGGCGATPHRRGGDRLHRAGPGQGQDAQRGKLSEQGNDWGGIRVCRVRGKIKLFLWEKYNFVFGRNNIIQVQLCLGEKYYSVMEK